MDIILGREERSTFERAIDTYGIRNQEDVAIEEMSELTKAIIKNRRYNTEETKANIVEEMADVLIMLFQLVKVYGVPSQVYEAKMNRLKQRLNEVSEPPVFKESKPVLKVTSLSTGETSKQPVIRKVKVKDELQEISIGVRANVSIADLGDLILGRAVLDDE